MEAAHQPEPQGDGGEGNPGGGKGERFAPSLWSFATFMAGMVTILIITFIVLANTDKEADPAAILGILVPAIVSLGTAAFGISVAREESKKRGEAEQRKEHAEREKGEADVARDKAERNLDRSQRRTEELATKVTDGFGPLLESIRNLGDSPPGTDGLELRALAGSIDMENIPPDTPVDQVLPPIESIEVSGKQLAQAEDALRLASEIES